MRRFSFISSFFLFIGIIISPVPQQSMAQDQTVTTTSKPGAAGLDLQAVSEIVKQSKDAADIESKLNAPGSINNLDLDGDGNVDYIEVTEYGTGNMRGFSLTVTDSAGVKQEIATVEIQRVNNTASINVVGNEDIYGPGEYYTGVWAPTEIGLWLYLWHPHRFYYSPYHFGYYPSYYHPYRRIGYDSYHSHVTIIARPSVIHRAALPRHYKFRSPNARRVNRGRPATVRPAPRGKPDNRGRSRQESKPRSGQQSRRRDRE